MSSYERSVYIWYKQYHPHATNYFIPIMTTGSWGCRRPHHPGSLKPSFPSLKSSRTSLFSSTAFVVGEQTSGIPSKSLRSSESERNQGIWKSRTARTSTSCVAFTMGSKKFRQIESNRTISFWIWNFSNKNIYKFKISETRSYHRIQRYRLGRKQCVGYSKTVQ